MHWSFRNEGLLRLCRLTFALVEQLVSRDASRKSVAKDARLRSTLTSPHLVFLPASSGTQSKAFASLLSAWSSTVSRGHVLFPNRPRLTLSYSSGVACLAVFGASYVRRVDKSRSSYKHIS